MDAPAVTSRAVPPRQLAWLRTELADWASDGVITDAQAERIAVRYRPGAHQARIGVGRVLLHLGGGFVGVGLIWLVAANLDQLSPVARFVAVALIWLSLLIGGEVLAARRASAPVVAAARLLAALAVGAVVFQTAQSLQVPAFEPRLVGIWSAAALVHAYAVRARLPFLVGVATGVGWWLGRPMWDEPSGLTAVLVLGAGAVLAASLAVLHDGRLPSFARVWRTVAGGMALLALYVAAVPGIGADEVAWDRWLLLPLVVAGAVTVGAAVVRPGWRLLEPAGAVVVLVVATLLAMWQTGTGTTSVDAADWAHATVSVAAYVVLAVGLVALGTVRDHAALTWMAMAGLVVFTTFQSFAVFAPIVTGAWLFVVLGTVFLGTGFLFDRARRELARALDPDTAPEGTDR